VLSLGRFAIQRTFHALGMYLLLVLAFALVFDSVADRGLKAQMDDEVALALRAAGPLEADQAAALRNRLETDLTARYHLDEPWAGRVFWRAWDTLTFHFGQATSLKAASGDRAVLTLIAEALPHTVALFLSEAVLVFLLGGMVGLLAARKPRGKLDKTLSVVPMVLGGFPVWWAGMLALMAFSYLIPLFPSGGVRSNPPPSGWAAAPDYLWHLALPLATLVVLNLWAAGWQIRNLVVGTVETGWVTAARARGVSEGRILGVHVLAAAKPAVLTLVVLGLLESLSGNLLVEGIFQWPGLGSLYFAAVQQNDVPVVLALLSLQTLINLAGLVVLDLTYRLLDPRLRLEAPR